MVKQRSAPDRKRDTAEEAKLREAVMSEVLDIKPSESWNDIAGLSNAKQVIQLLLPPHAVQDLYTTNVDVCSANSKNTHALVAC